MPRPRLQRAATARREKVQGLPGPAADEDWTNSTTIDYFSVQQQKVAAFASGMHARLGAASGVSWLDEHSRWC